MRKVLVSLYLCLNIAFANGAFQCVEKSNSVSPLLISEATYSKIPQRVYENLWQEVMPKYKAAALLPRLSIVEVDAETASKFSDIQKSKVFKNRYVAVKVRKIAPMSLIEHLDKAEVSKNGKQYFGIYNRMSDAYLPAKIGDEGVILSNSLSPLGEYSFILNEDSPLFSASYEEFKGKVLTPMMKDDGSYIYDECCDDKENCFLRYKFIVDAQKDKVLNFDNIACKNIELLNPSLPAHTNSLYQIYRLIKEENPEFKQDDLAYFHQFQPERNRSFLEIFYKETTEGKKLWNQLSHDEQSVLNERWDNAHYAKGLVRMSIDTETGKGPYKICHYKTRENNNDYYSDHFAHPASACTFYQISKMFTSKIKSNIKSCEVWLGHAFHSEDWGVHISHKDGTCFDVGSFSTEEVTDDKRVATSFCSKNHDKDKTFEFLSLLNKAGAVKIHMNPNCSYLSKKTGKVVSYRWLSHADSRAYNIKELKGDESHKTHIHFCLPPSSLQVTKTCEEGIGGRFYSSEGFESLSVKSIDEIIKPAKIPPPDFNKMKWEIKIPANDFNSRKKTNGRRRH